METLHRIYITIAKILIEVTNPLSNTNPGFEERLGPFFGFSENPLACIHLRLETSTNPPAPHGDLIYDPGLIWKMYRAGPDYYAEITYHKGNQVAQEHGVLHANPTWNYLTLTEQRTSFTQQSLLNVGAGELILRTVILFTGGLVFHSSGLDDNGKGIVFIGHSGAGKSTQLNLWNREPGVIAMNDDRIAVRVEAGGPMCYGLPWGGTADIARNHSAPLVALILLEQASENVIKPISPVVAFSLLMARAFLPYWDPSLMLKAMSNINAILASVPVYLLRCQPEQAVIPLVRSVL